MIDLSLSAEVEDIPDDIDNSPPKVGDISDSTMLVDLSAMDVDPSGASLNLSAVARNPSSMSRHTIFRCSNSACSLEAKLSAGMRECCCGQVNYIYFRGF